MRTLIVSATPKTEGHSAELTAIAAAAAERAGAECQVLRLDELKLEACKMCGDGWGVCRDKFRCAFEADGFDKVQEKLAWAEAVVLITPVYWWECSESMKIFMDRVRRCEGSRMFHGMNDQSLLWQKPFVMVACAGGSGNGTLSALDQMDRFVCHCGGKFFDHIALNRWTFDHKKLAVDAAVFKMASEGGGARRA
ncbi:MAG: flavodoxin family protein [Oscillospiraceae bacterium]|nr:flavodoxin family protein [Oscillospiraceae bacterium]